MVSAGERGGPDLQGRKGSSRGVRAQEERSPRMSRVSGLGSGGAPAKDQCGLWHPALGGGLLRWSVARHREQGRRQSLPAPSSA